MENKRKTATCLINHLLFLLGFHMLSSCHLLQSITQWALVLLKPQLILIYTHMHTTDQYSRPHHILLSNEQSCAHASKHLCLQSRKICKILCLPSFIYNYTFPWRGRHINADPSLNTHLHLRTSLQYISAHATFTHHCVLQRIRQHVSPDGESSCKGVTCDISATITVDLKKKKGWMSLLWTVHTGLMSGLNCTMEVQVVYGSVWIILGSWTGSFG